MPHDSRGNPINASVAVVPALLTGRTDSAKFEDLSDGGIYRFMPLSLNLTAGDTGLIHNIDERVHVNNFIAAVSFYVEAIRRLSSHV